LRSLPPDASIRTFTGAAAKSDIADYDFTYAKLPKFEHNLSALAPESTGIT